jgi:hypothetical protein
MTTVLIEWSYLERELWNEQVADELLVADEGHKIVVFGTAIDRETGQPLAAVFGPCCCERERDAYIEQVLGPQMNARLDAAVGRLAWRWDASNGRTLGAA